MAEERRIREEKESLQRQVIRQERLAAIGVLVSGVAHELNNPLQAILGFAELLQMHEELPEPVRHDLALIQKESTRASGIIRNLQRFGRRPRSRRPSARPMSWPRWWSCDSGSSSRRTSSSTSTISPRRPSLAVFTELQQVVLNFLINAEQAVSRLDPARRRITIRTSDGRNSTRLEVEDNGPGVPPGDEAKLFQPFFTTKPVGRRHRARPLGQLRNHHVARRSTSATVRPTPAGRSSSSSCRRT